MNNSGLFIIHIPSRLATWTLLWVYDGEKVYNSLFNETNVILSNRVFN